MKKKKFGPQVENAGAPHVAYRRGTKQISAGAIQQDAVAVLLQSARCDQLGHKSSNPRQAVHENTAQCSRAQLSPRAVCAISTGIGPLARQQFARRDYSGVS